jgi:radical SAM protein with 4Fe4S-binding SPASM domain
VVWQFVVFAHNEHQVEEVRKLGRSLGVDEVKIKTAQIYDFEAGNELMPSDKKYSRYEKESNGKFRIRNKLLNHCWRMWQGCVITWDGKVVPCCFDKDASHRLGDLHKESFSDVWFSEGYSRFRQTILRGRKSIDICTNCTEGTKVWS